ncbi:MAG TPA: sulfocyanin-like copper-binding protein [Gemmatimonadota bacterium]|nr:sulfocyanin-like copper-binding protein [Gemmatimonadota bacterium]
MRLFSTLSLVFAFGLVACGGGAEEGGTDADTTAMEIEEPAAPAGLTTPGWMSVDETAQTVTMQVSAGSTDANNRWNFNGMYAGAGSITVPAGYTVTIDFTNADPTQPHSLGIDEMEASWSATFETVEPAFAGAVTPDATTTGTAPNGTASITFTATDAGDYAMVCYIPGHAVAGMVIPFHVSADGSYGATQ